jgi:hypothetical protein
MKKTTLLAGLIACIFFMSCKKDSVSNASSNGSSLESRVSFSLGDSTYVINGSLADSSIHGSIFIKYDNDTAIASVYNYMLEVKYSGVELWLAIPTGTLTTTTYNEVTMSSGDHPSFLDLSNGNQPIYGIEEGTQYYGTPYFVNLTVQNIHDGSYADGIFTAHVIGSGGGGVDASITNGSFKNVKILY